MMVNLQEESDDSYTREANNKGGFLGAIAKTAAAFTAAMALLGAIAYIAESVKIWRGSQKENVSVRFPAPHWGPKLRFSWPRL